MELYPNFIEYTGWPPAQWPRGKCWMPLKSPFPVCTAPVKLGSMWGVIYQEAGNNAESIVVGRIAGKNAAAEKSWK